MSKLHPDVVIITARRWRDRNGNTYFRTHARIVTGAGAMHFPFVSAIEYGYGYHYLEVTLQHLRERGDVHSKGDHTVFHTVTDVATRKALMAPWS